MKKIATLGLFSIIFATSATAYGENLIYGSYRILSNQKFIYQGRNISTTYVIASNPDMGIVIEPPDSGTIKRIQSGTLRNCYEITGDALDHFFGRVQKANISASQMQVVSRMGGGPLTGEYRQLYEYLKNLVVFDNEASGMPLYECERSTQVPKK